MPGWRILILLLLILLNQGSVTLGCRLLCLIHPYELQELAEVGPSSVVLPAAAGGLLDALAFSVLAVVTSRPILLTLVTNPDKVNATIRVVETPYCIFFS